MSVYKCKNFGSCSRADFGEEFSLAAGGDDKCPECGFTLVGVDDIGAVSSKENAFGSKKQMLIVGLIGAVVLAAAGGGYWSWKSKKVVELRPDASYKYVPLDEKSANPSSGASVAGAGTSGGASAATPKPAPMVANEVAARKTCDEATKAKHNDAAKICRHATAITLMNSGVLAAIDGKLDQAEKDYLAAKDKDPDFPELYFNIAVLKARQNKASEAVDNLTLANTKGFTQFSAIKSEPALQKLKSDSTIKFKIEALEAK